MFAHSNSPAPGVRPPPRAQKGEPGCEARAGSGDAEPGKPRATVAVRLRVSNIGGTPGQGMRLEREAPNPVLGGRKWGGPQREALGIGKWGVWGKGEKGASETRGTGPAPGLGKAKVWWESRLETRDRAVDRGHPGRPPVRPAQGPAPRGAAPSRSRSSRGDRNNSAGGGESNSGPGAGMTPPPRGAAGPAPAPPPSAFESGHPPPPLPPAAASCTNPLGPSCKSNAPSRPHATCAAANGYAVPPGPPRGPGEQQSGGGATRRARLALPPPDSSGNCGSPLSQEAIRRAGWRASNKQTPPAAAAREQGRRRAAATLRRGLCAGLRRGDGAGPPPRADPERLGPLGDARAAAGSRLGAAARPRLYARRLSPAQEGGLQKLAPGPTSTCPRAA